MKKIIKTYKTVLSILVLIIVSTISVISCQEQEDYTYVPEAIQPITVTEFIPTIGDIGYKVEILGTNFSPVKANNKVLFNGVNAIVTAVSEDFNSIIVTVPEGATTGNLTVSHADVTINAGIFSVVDIPVIESFNPTAASIGDEVVIIGEKFSETASENLVWFNGTVATVTTSTSTTITTTVPEGTTTGPIKVEVNGQSDTSETDFILASLVSVKLTSDDDDVEEVAVDFGEPVGTMVLDSSDLEFGEKSSGEGLMNVGLRYNNVAIPQGATILESYVQFKTDHEGANAVEITIYGENTGNATPYEETLNNLSNRSLTTANVVWDVPEWVAEGDRGEAQKTFNIASIIQEIVNRSDWTAGNSINIIMKNTGVSATVTSSSGGREAENYSSSKPDDGAELFVIYQ